MKSISKKVLIIVLSILIMGLIAAIPGFAETQEELKSIFVTREEVDVWINGNGASTGISEVLANLEINMQEQVQAKVKVEMSRRGIKDAAETSEASD